MLERQPLRTYFISIDYGAVRYCLLTRYLYAYRARYLVARHENEQILRFGRSCVGCGQCKVLKSRGTDRRKYFFSARQPTARPKCFTLEQPSGLSPSEDRTELEQTRREVRRNERVRAGLCDFGNEVHESWPMKDAPSSYCAVVRCSDGSHKLMQGGRDYNTRRGSTNLLAECQGMARGNGAYGNVGRPLR